MSVRLLSVLGMFVSVACLVGAASIYPGGFDWNRDYVSTLLRGPSGPARGLADAGVLLFCLSIALVFERLARAAEFSKIANLLRIGGVGSMVYSGLTITPMHDLMVTLSVIFFLVAVLSITRALYHRGEIAYFVTGSTCLAVFAASATLYYTGPYNSVLPWAQRASYVLFAIWLVCLDFGFRRGRLRIGEAEQP